MLTYLASKHGKDTNRFIHRWPRWLSALRAVIQRERGREREREKERERERAVCVVFLFWLCAFRVSSSCLCTTLGHYLFILSRCPMQRKHEVKYVLPFCSQHFLYFVKKPVSMTRKCHRPPTNLRLRKHTLFVKIQKHSSLKLNKQQAKELKKQT